LINFIRKMDNVDCQKIVEAIKVSCPSSTSKLTIFY